MKTTFRIFAAIAMIAGFTTTAMSQNTPVGTAAPTSAGAKIVKALSLTQTSPLHFGTMTIPTTAVEVALSTANVRTPSAAVLTLLAQSPVSTNAGYNVVGSNGATYAIQLPADNVVTITEGSTPMHVDSFIALSTSTSSGTGGTLDASAGTDHFVVGATLKLASGQPFGVYTGTFNVTVAYN